VTPDSGQRQCVAPPLAVLRLPEVQEQVRAAGLSYRRKIFEAQEQSLAALWRCSEAIVAQQGSKRGTAALGTQRAVFTPVPGVRLCIWQWIQSGKRKFEAPPAHGFCQCDTRLGQADNRWGRILINTVDSKTRSNGESRSLARWRHSFIGVEGKVDRLMRIKAP